MQIEAKLKLDIAGKPYWSMLLTHNGAVKLEVVGTTFDMNLTKLYWESYEHAFIRMMKEIQRQPDQLLMKRLFLAEETKP